MKITLEISVDEMNKALGSLAAGVVQGLAEGTAGSLTPDALMRMAGLAEPAEGMPQDFHPSGEDKPATFDVVDGGLAEGASGLGATGPGGAVGASSPVQDLPAEENSPQSTDELPEISLERRAASWEKFREVVALWTINFAQTHEVEVEVKEPLRNEEGVLIDAEGNPVRRGQKPTYRTRKLMETRPKEQPNRQKALASLGSGPHTLPILVMAYEEGSLQGLVEKALRQLPDDGYEKWRPYADEGYESWLDYVEQIANTMVQVSHVAFPDLAGTLDYSSKWRRSR